MTETLANGYSIESTQPELSDEYQLGRVKNTLRLIALGKVASALEGLMISALLCYRHHCYPSGRNAY